MVHKRTRKTLKSIDKNNKALFGGRASMKNASIFTAPGLQKAVKMDQKRRRNLKARRMNV